MNPQCVDDNSTTAVQQYSIKYAELCQNGAGIDEKMKYPKIQQGATMTKKASTLLFKKTTGSHSGNHPKVSGTAHYARAGQVWRTKKKQKKKSNKSGGHHS